MSDAKQGMRIAVGLTSAKLSVFFESSAFERELESYVASRFAISSYKNERRHAFTLHTVAPALRSGRGLKHYKSSGGIYRVG